MISPAGARPGVERFEWAASVPGSLAGNLWQRRAFGGDMAGSLDFGGINPPPARAPDWPVSKLECDYRSSLLKREHPPVLAAFGGANPEARPTRRNPKQNGAIFQPAAEPPTTRRQHGFHVQEPAGDNAGDTGSAGLKGKSIGKCHHQHPRMPTSSLTMARPGQRICER